MKKIVFVLLVAVILSGCKNHSNSLKTVESIEVQTELKMEFKSNHLIYNGKDIKTDLIDKAIGYGGNELVLISGREKTVFITDLALNVKKRFDLSKKNEMLLNENPFDAFINADTLFMADNSMSIKKLNLITGETNKIPLKGMIYFSQPYYMSFSKDGNYIYTFNCFPNTTKDKIKKGDYVIGAVFSPNGNLIEQLAVDKDVFEHELIGKDRALYTAAGNKHYIYFEMEKNVLILDSMNNKIAIKSLYVNKDWTKPVYEKKQISAYAVNTQRFVPYGDKFIHWPPPGNFETRGRVVIYDGDIQPVKKVYLAGLEKTAFYSYFICDSKLIVFSDGHNGDNNVYEYDLKGI